MCHVFASELSVNCFEGPPNFCQNPDIKKTNGTDNP
jgi:hypothetical protein